MRTTTKRPAVGKNRSSRQPEKHHNISAKVAAAMEQARLQEYKEQQERPEKQLTDLSERAIVDIAVSIEDIARGNGGRKTAATKGRERKATAGGSGGQEREPTHGQPAGKAYGYSSESNALDQYAADKAELEPDTINLMPRDDIAREPMGNLAKQQAGDLPPAKKNKEMMNARSAKAPAKDKPVATVLVKTITVTVQSPDYMAEQYKFDTSAKGALNEMLTDYRSELLAFVSVSPGGVDLSDAELAVIIRELPAGDKGAAIVKVAFTRLGDPYHQELRFTGRYIDCSGLSMWSYKQLGINIPGTAAEQGRFCVENDVVVSRAALVPGDLVFYSDKSNGRYMNITHVAVYVGDGMIIDASSSRGQVVYRKMWGSPIMYGRPHIL